MKRERVPEKKCIEFLRRRVRGCRGKEVRFLEKWIDRIGFLRRRGYGS